MRWTVPMPSPMNRMTFFAFWTRGVGNHNRCLAPCRCRCGLPPNATVADNESTAYVATMEISHEHQWYLDQQGEKCASPPVGPHTV